MDTYTEVTEDKGANKNIHLESRNSNFLINEAENECSLIKCSFSKNRYILKFLMANNTKVRQNIHNTLSKLLRQKV